MSPDRPAQAFLRFAEPDHARELAEDTAAVLAVLAALSSRPTIVPEAPRVRAAWADPAHQLRAAPSPGSNAWWAAGLPD